MTAAFPRTAEPEVHETAVECMRCAADRYRKTEAESDACAQACVAAATALLTSGRGGITAAEPALVRCAVACEAVGRPRPFRRDPYLACARSCRRLAEVIS